MLTDILTPERILVPLEAANKEDVLRELADCIVGSGDGEDAAGEVLRAVRERENVLSTGIGNGVAIPHGKSPALPELRMAAGRSEAPVDFGALDGRPVRLFFFLMGPDTAAGPHIKALSRISRLVRREAVRERLLSAPDAQAFYRVLEETGAT